MFRYSRTGPLNAPTYALVDGVSNVSALHQVYLVPSDRSIGCGSDEVARRIPSCP